MPIKSSELRERDTVKTVLNRFGECIYFTRSPIPCFRHRSNLNPSVFRHIGIYCYKRDTLFRYASLKPTYLEETESLEQMRLIENGIRIYAFITEKEYRKIDNIRDLQKIRREDGFKKEE
jgi:3-deoxy-manno-octulosonate cytidylyltransferase (CMP-KDO synthetase)